MSKERPPTEILLDGIPTYNVEELPLGYEGSVRVARVPVHLGGVELLEKWT